MITQERYTKTIRLRINPELLKHVKKEADKLDTDVSSYIRWCIRTGLYLDDLNKFIRVKSQEEDESNDLEDEF
ncbi:MAG: hypothetical protein ACXAB2_10185 [Candidatus Hodarchaeales archaeon]|jgi:hypothetical protein